MIDQDYQARLADFGLLTFISDPTNPTNSSSITNAGTTRWMSPELLHPEEFGFKQSRPTKQSDCYALGMVILEVLSGEAPFAGDKDFIVMRKVIEGKRPERPEGARFLDGLWRTLEQCWLPQPKERPTVEAILECLGQVSESWQPLPPAAEDVEADDDETASTTSQGRFLNFVSNASLTTKKDTVGSILDPPTPNEEQRRSLRQVGDAFNDDSPVLPAQQRPEPGPPGSNQRQRLRVITQFDPEMAQLIASSPPLNAPISPAHLERISAFLPTSVLPRTHSVSTNAPKDTAWGVHDDVATNHRNLPAERSVYQQEQPHTTGQRPRLTVVTQFSPEIVLRIASSPPLDAPIDPPSHLRLRFSEGFESVWDVPKYTVRGRNGQLTINNPNSPERRFTHQLTTTQRPPIIPDFRELIEWGRLLDEKTEEGREGGWN